MRNSIASLRRVLATGRPDAVEFQKYDVEIPGSPGQFARRYWSVVNAPVFGPDGRVALPGGGNRAHAKVHVSAGRGPGARTTRIARR
jgi:hypothetical protein